MANGNPYAITPAGDMTQGLAGLSNVLAQVGEQRQQQQLLDQEAAQKRAQQEEAQAAFDSGDPMAMAELSLKYPDMRESIDQATGMRGDYQREDMQKFLTGLMTDPQNADQLYQQRIRKLQAQGRDPSETIASYQKFLEDPEAAMQGNEIMFATRFPEEYKSMREAMAEPEREDLDIVQVYPADGEPYTAQTDRKGQYFSMGGEPIDVGDRDRVVDSAQLAGTAESMGLTQKEKENLDSTIISTRNFSDTVDDALQMIEERPDLNTLTARGAALVNDLQTEIQAMGNAFGFEFDESMLDPSEHADVFDDMGIQNQRMQSLVTNLAFARAQANNPDGRISNADFRAAVSEIGGAAADPRAFSQVLQDVRNRAIRNFETMYRVKTGEPYSGMPLMREGGPAGVQQGQQGGGVQEGATATNPNTGERIVFQNGQWVPIDG